MSGIRDSRKAGSLWGMMRGVGGVRKSIHHSWEFRNRFLWKRFIGKRPELFKSGQWHFQQDNAPVHNSILVTDYLTKMGIKTVPQPPYRPDLAPCNSEVVVLRQLRRWKRLWQRSLTPSHKRTSMGPSRSCWNGTTSALQVEEITLKGTRVSYAYYL